MWFIKVLTFLWPFVKEMVLGDKSLRDAIQTNKLRALTLIVFFLSVALNVFCIQRLVVITRDHLQYVKLCTEAQTKVKDLQANLPKHEPPKVVLPVAETPSVPAKKEAVHENSQQDRYRSLVSSLNKIREHEEVESTGP